MQYFVPLQVYYPVRHHLVQHLINYMQRLGFPPTASLEHRKLAVDIADVIIKWEAQRIKDDEKDIKLEDGSVESVGITACDGANKRSSDEGNVQRKKANTNDSSRNQISQSIAILADVLFAFFVTFCISCFIRYIWYCTKSKDRRWLPFNRKKPL